MISDTGVSDAADDFLFFCIQKTESVIIIEVAFSVNHRQSSFNVSIKKGAIMEKIKDCPGCGSAELIIHVGYRDGAEGSDSRKYACVVCRKCGCRGPEASIPTQMSLLINEEYLHIQAVRAWMEEINAHGAEQTEQQDQ